MNEENGVRGGAAYAQALGGQFGTHVAAIEADSGAGRPLGLLAFVTPESVKRLDPIVAALRPLGATVVKRVDSAVGADISALEEQGVPGLEPLLDGRTYFHYHHTPADTFDKVDPEWLRRQVAVLAVMAYALADEAEPLPRVAPKPGPH